MWASPIHVNVEGLPIAQGSKTPVPLVGKGRFPLTVNNVGELLRLVGMRESAKGLDDWRKAVRDEAERVMGELQLDPIKGPVLLLSAFFFPRPKTHFGTGRNAEVLKASAPLYPTGKPDWDKLERAIGDALSGVVFEDDSQVVNAAASKNYADDVVPPGVRLSITPYRYTQSSPLT